MKLARRLVRPISRPAMLFLFWTRRHTIKMWFTSVKAELGRGAFEWPRFKTLLQALVKLTTDPKIGNSPKVRSVRVTGDVVEVDADPNWTKLPFLRSALTEVPSISRVDVAPGTIAPTGGSSSSPTEELFVESVSAAR